MIEEKDSKLPEMGNISEENEKRLKRLKPFDDDFARILLKDRDLVQFVLRIVTGISDLVVEESQTQYDMKRLLGVRSLWLDAYAKDKNGELYNIEVQRADSGASPLRARYHSSSIDVEILKKKEDFDTLPTTYVIFITEKDVFGKGEKLYKFGAVNLENRDELFGDKRYYIYVNGECSDDGSDIAKLMHDFHCSNPNDMYYDNLADACRFYKEEGGKEKMCQIWEEVREEGKAKGLEQGRAEGRAQGRAEGQADLAKKLRGMTSKERDAYLEELSKGEI